MHEWSFSHVALKLWSMLPLELQLVSTLFAFGKGVKTQLFKFDILKILFVMFLHGVFKNVFTVFNLLYTAMAFHRKAV